MDKEHRAKIQRNYAKLVQDCDIDSILPVLVQKNVFTSAMVSKYMNPNEDDLTRKRTLFLDVPKRGPNAFSSLVASLREIGQTFLANLLEPNSNNNSSNNINNSSVPNERRHAHPFMLPETEDTEKLQNLIINAPNSTKVNIGTEPTKIAVKAAARFFDDPIDNDVDVYSTHSKRRGAALIINNMTYINDVQNPRFGAEVDGKNLKELFLQMGFWIEEYIDLTHQEMKRAILKFKSSSKLMGVDMAFVILMGHGYHESDVTYVLGIDNKGVSASWVEQQFDNANCKALLKRPKIIMYQTCRGEAADVGVGVVAHHSRIEIDSGAFNTVLRTRDDMLVAHSTIPGFASHRDIYLGSWYISLFCETMMTYACSKHIEEIFKMVDSQLAQLRSADKTMQTSMFINLGFKNCYMHPKIYLHEDVIKNIHDDSQI